jgi:Protein of unknown function (DUF3592)
MNWQAIRIYTGIAFFAAFVIHFVWSDRREQQLIENGPSWPTVEGTIFESEVRTCSKGAKHAPQVRYTYSVQEKSYDGEVRFKSAHCGAQQDAQAIVDAYPVTFTFPVHVDPKTRRLRWCSRHSSP